MTSRNAKIGVYCCNTAKRKKKASLYGRSGLADINLPKRLNFVAMSPSAPGIARLLKLDEPLGIALLLLGSAGAAPFLTKPAGIIFPHLA